MVRLKLSAYTLIEVLAAAAIFTGMMIVAMGTFAMSASKEVAFSNRRIVNRSSKLAVQTIIQEVAVSKNKYDSDPASPTHQQIKPGDGAYMILNFDGTNLTPANYIDSDANLNQLGTSAGNALLIFYLDRSTNLRKTKAYYLCSHPKNSTKKTLVVSDLNITDGNVNTNWAGIQAGITCASGYEPLVSNSVAISSLTFSGFFPEQNLTSQPILTVAVNIQNLTSTKAGEAVTSSYRESITHRDFGFTNNP